MRVLATGAVDIMVRAGQRQVETNGLKAQAVQREARGTRASCCRIGARDGALDSTTTGEVQLERGPADEY